MNQSRLRKRMDAIAAILDEVPVDDAGNPIWELPACMDDDLAGDSDSNPLGRLIRILAAEIVRHDAKLGRRLAPMKLAHIHAWHRALGRAKPETTPIGRWLVCKPSLCAGGCARRWS